jgi:hypothetical protein
MLCILRTHALPPMISVAWVMRSRCGMTISLSKRVTTMATSKGCPQYVDRPPVMSNTDPVVNEQSSLHSQATIAAISLGCTKRPMGILPSM